MGHCGDCVRHWGHQLGPVPRSLCRKIISQPSRLCRVRDAWVSMVAIPDVLKMLCRAGRSNNGMGGSLSTIVLSSKLNTLKQDFVSFRCFIQSQRYFNLLKERIKVSGL